jgi:hypothetical protein
MSHAFRLVACATVLISGLAAGRPAHAETFHSCVGFIDALPATISTPGVWCLRKDLSTAITSGAAITVAANNVTIDCNGLRIGGLAAGNGSAAYGILTEFRQNVTVRNCNIRGFYVGAALQGGDGHVVEHNRFDNNLFSAIQVGGGTSLTRGNFVTDTGGRAGDIYVQAIVAWGDIVDNVVSGLYADMPGGTLHAIAAPGADTLVRGNRVSGFEPTAAQGGTVHSVYGIRVIGQGAKRARVSDNHVTADGVPGYGIEFMAYPAFCTGNTVTGFTNENIAGACVGSGNLVVN